MTAALDDVLNAWTTETGQHPPSGLSCADPYPWDDAVLCRRLDGHSGTHASDGGDHWTEGNDR